MKADCISKNEQETTNFGRKIAASLHGGDIIALHGDLGAGKTTLIKGIATHFGINDVVSPTFTLMQVYQIQNSKFKIENFVHIDTYRLNNEQELTTIGIADYLGAPDTICLIEWPEKIPNLLKNKKVLRIALEHTESETARQITLYT